jgi:hypothetical protein
MFGPAQAITLDDLTNACFEEALPHCQPPAREETGRATDTAKASQVLPLA